MNIIRIRHTALAAMLALSAATGQAGVLDSLLLGRNNNNEPARPGQRSWRIAEFTYVRLVPIEAGAERNDHPVRIDPEQLRALLATARLPQEGRDEPLFGAEELSELVEPLSQALSVAGAADDVTLQSSSRRGKGFLTQPRAVTARLFVRDGRLNLLAKDTRREFMDAYRGTQIEPKFEFGSRAAPSGAVVGSSISTSSRADWLSLPLNAVPAPAAALPGAAPAPAPAAAPAAATAPTPRPVRDEAFYEAQEVRLKGLKRLFDKGLITEAEYQQQRRDIISGL
jgi:hypothetical protein